MADHWISRELVDEYAILSHDFNPLHTDAAHAEASAFGRLIPHGFLILGDAFSALAQLGPTQRTLSVDFHAPGPIDGLITTRIEDGERPSSFQVLDADGVVVADGRLTLGSET